jgi:predicted amidohydrolase
MRAAVVQMNSGADVARNLEMAERLVRDAAADGAELVLLPEKWNLLRADGGPEERSVPYDEAAGPPRAWARELGIWLVAGSLAVRHPGEEKARNTSICFAPDGELVASYDKLHMFDVDVDGVAYRESEAEEAGQELVLARAADTTLGLSVCFDLRFPELYRILAVRGARIFTVPSAFTAPTGRAHWEVLLRARAIENACFVLAADQIGPAPPNHDSWGHSMIVDPWGKVLAEAPDEECFVAADLDLAELDRVRAAVPALANRRADVYLWPEEARA